MPTSSKIHYPLVATAIIMLAGLLLTERYSNAEKPVSCPRDYNNALPASHPHNICHSQTADISWLAWLSGRSQSSQLHFVDLFELLYRQQEKSSPLTQPQPSQEL